MAKILLTGTTGFIGSHLLLRLVADGHLVYAVVRNEKGFKEVGQKGGFPFLELDTNDHAKLDKFICEQKFDGVVHLASLFVKEHAREQIPTLVDSNITFGTRILNAACSHNVAWFVNTGTFWQHYQDEEYSPVNLYAATKQAFEAVARYYLETHETSIVTLKLSDTYGPNDTRRKLLNLLTDSARSGDLLEMSKGEQLLDILHVDDVVDGFVRLVDLLSSSKRNEIRGRAYALHAKRLVTVRDFVAIFAKATGLNPNIDWGARPYNKREVMQPWTGGEKLPGWEQKIDLLQGLRKLFE